MVIGTEIMPKQKGAYLKAESAAKLSIEQISSMMADDHFEDDEDEDDEDKESEDDDEDDSEEDDQNDKDEEDTIEDKNEEDGAEVPAKKQKLDKSALYKAPTNEELNQLKEAENLFHSSLFKLQVTELLSEVKPKQKKKATIDKFVDTLSSFLTTMKPGVEHELSDTTWLKKMKVKLPIKFDPPSTKGNFRFHPPKSIKIMGSYSLSVCLQSKPCVDLAVEMPKECFQAKDHLNQRYLRKRALYLAVLAKRLRSCDAVEDISFTYHHGNQIKPILVAKPSVEHGKGFSIHLHPYPEEGVFKLNRFHIEKNNIRGSWYKDNDTDSANTSETTPDPPTPYYNSWVLEDLVRDTNHGYTEHILGNHQNIRDGIILLKIWLHQRQLDQGAGSFNGYLMTMYVVYLLCKRKLNPMMSCYQVMRNSLVHLANFDWTKDVITFATGTDPNRPLPVDFQQVFDLVFIDKTGYVNLAANVYKVTWERLKHEVILGIKILDLADVEAFNMLFMTPIPFTQTYDQLVHIRMADYGKLCSKLASKASIIDYCGNMEALCVPRITQVLNKAFGSRLHLLGLKLHPPKTWSMNSSPEEAIELKLTLGLLENHQYSHSILEKGPSADSPQAAEFRDFWGEKSELRRFQDASICEAVVWNCKTLADRRKISGRIAKYILHRHTGLTHKSITCVTSALDILLNLPQRQSETTTAYGTGEEHIQHIHRCFDELAKMLRAMKDLSLTIHTIQGVAPVWRYTEVFPSLASASNKGSVSDQLDIRLPVSHSRVPVWRDVLPVMCMLEGSGKWPDDKEAVVRVKAAFLLKIREVLAEQHDLVCQITSRYLDVLLKGYVFRIEIGYMKEINLLKIVKTPEGMVKMINTEAAVSLEHHLVREPLVTSILHGIHQANSTFSCTVRLAKRWLSSHMLLDGCIAEMDVDLIVAYLYTTPEPYTQPGSPQVGFLRFLSLLCSHDWSRYPLIVNLNNELTRDDYGDIRGRFTRDRTTLPLLCICTPMDKELFPVKLNNQPTAPILQRIVLLAKESVEVLARQISQMENIDYKHIFRPPLESYDVIIHLEISQLSRQHEAVDLSKEVHLPLYTTENINPQRSLPVVQYNPAMSYLNELRSIYGDIAMFFHDIYGGSIIAVVWKSQAFKPHVFKASRVHAAQIDQSATSKSTMLAPNIEAILEGFKTIGEGLVRKLDSNTDYWTI